MSKHNKRAKEIIEKILYLTIATVSKNGEPWNAPVVGAHDKDYNFYWGSHKDSQHSQNVRDTGKVYLVIYDSTVPEGTGEGVYVKARASELNDPRAIKEAHQILQARYSKPYWKLSQVQGAGPIRLYKAVPEKVWMNADGEVNGTYIDTRVEVDLISVK